MGYSVSCQQDNELLKARVLCCMIGVSLGIISERNDADRTEWYNYSHSLSNSIMLCFSEFGDRLPVSTETCFTFPSLLGLSIYFKHMLKRHYVFDNGCLESYLDFL